MLDLLSKSAPRLDLSHGTNDFSAATFSVFKSNAKALLLKTVNMIQALPLVGCGFYMLVTPGLKSQVNHRRSISKTTGEQS